MRRFVLVPLVLLLVSVQADGQPSIQGGAANAPLSCNGINCTMASGQILLPAGTVSAPSLAWSTATQAGIYQPGGNLNGWGFVRGASEVMRWDQTNLYLAPTFTLGWGSAIGSFDVILTRDAAAVLADKNGANAQTFRIYGTTTGPKYLSLSHDGTNGIVDTAASSGNLQLGPTNATDILWGKPLVGLGGGAAPTLGTIGGSGPATAGQNAWMRVLDSTGTAFWVPVWK